MADLFLSLYFPYWSTDLEQRDRATPRPLALSESQRGQEIVVRADARAETQGVFPGIPVALARARCPLIQIRSARFSYDYSVLETVARWLFNYSPLVALDSDLRSAQRTEQLSQVSQKSWGLVLNLRGMEKMHPRREGVLWELGHRFERQCIQVKAALAPTIGAAWACARFHPNPGVLLDAENVRKTLEPLPIEALRLGEKQKNLEALGIRSIAELLRLPRKAVNTRFGSFVLTRLDQALGAQSEALEHCVLPETFQEQRTFEVPLQQEEQVIEATFSLLERMTQRLQQRGLRAENYYLTFIARTHTQHKERVTKELGLQHATTDARHIRSVLTPVVEKLTQQIFQMHQGIEAILVYVDRIERAQAHYEQSIEHAGPSAMVREGCELINTLSAHVGPQNVTKVHFTESYLPERSFAYRPVKEPQQLNTLPYVAERPTILFTQPKPAQVIAMLPDKAPAWLSWGAKRYRVLQGIGPERISHEWWRELLGQVQPVPDRDYFKLHLDNGEWLWVYRENRTQAWFVQGMWG